jgi:2-dehydro-3-deoxyphosphogluconate aldolase / (4S)-4-hydroxy-2-oxoglutarate aldolase
VTIAAAQRPIKSNLPGWQLRMYQASVQPLNQSAFPDMLGAMDSKQVIDWIEKSRIIAILRGDFGDKAGEIVAALAEAGITAVEATLNSPNAIAMIRELSARFGAHLAIGAGTVLKPEEVQRAADVGACFIVSPNRNLSVIKATKQRGLVSIPGCFTPSEIAEALDAGADAAKLFPASCLGPGFVRALRGPMRDIKLVPTGGVTPQLAREYRTAGVWALGIGSELIGADPLSPGAIEQIAARARAFVAAAAMGPA